MLPLPLPAVSSTRGSSVFFPSPWNCVKRGVGGGGRAHAPPPTPGPLAKEEVFFFFFFHFKLCKAWSGGRWTSACSPSHFRPSRPREGLLFFFLHLGIV